MSDSLFVQPAPSANIRHETHFNRAHQHSIFVSLLKKTLPVAALCMVVWFVIVGFVNTSSIGDISVKSSGISNGMLVMESPKMSGFTRDNRPYDLIASFAKQNLTEPNIINLENLRATVPMQAKVFADIKAKSGIYNSDKEWLTLKTDIEINSQDGTKIILESAEIDLAKGNLSSQNPVIVSTSNSRITSEKVDVTDNGAKIIFKQRVRMTVLPAQDGK